MSPTSSRPRLTLELPKDVGSDMLDMKLNDCAPVRNNFLGAVGPLQAFIYIYIYIYCSIYIYTYNIYTLPETNSKSTCQEATPKGKDDLPTIHASFGEGINIGT